MTDPFNKILKQILRRPVPVLAIIAAITLLFASQLPRLSVQTSVYDLMIEDLPETVRYQVFKKTFGSDEIIRVVIRGKNVFDPAAFFKIEQIAKSASEVEGVRRVISLPDIRKSVNVSGKWDLKQFADATEPVELFKKNLISADRKTTILTLILENNADNEAVIRSVGKLLSRTLNSESQNGHPRSSNETSSDNAQAYPIGMPLVSQSLAKFTEADFRSLPPITLLVITVILLCLFQRVRLMLILPGCVILSLVWTFGLMAITGIPLSMVTMIVPVFLIAVGTACCLYISFAYLSCTKTAETPADAVFSTFSLETLPTVLTIFATVAGVLAFWVSRITAIREFAAFSCFGMLSLLVLVFTFVPAALSLIPLPPEKKRGITGIVCLFDCFVQKMITLNLNHRKIALSVIGLFAIFCAAGILRIRVETSPMAFFKKDTRISRHFHDICKDMSGSFPINVVMKSGEADYFEKPEHIAEIARFQKFLETLPGVDKTISFADYMKLVSYALNQFAAEYYTLPEEGVEGLISHYRMMLGEDMLSRFVTSDFSQANILLLTHISGSGDFLQTRKRILGYVAKNFSGNMGWDVTGFGMVISESSHLLTRGQMKSLSLTILLVLGIMIVLFLSVRVGLVAVVPNLFPIIVIFGMMGWLGIELSTVTGLIAIIAIGLAADDTIHYMVRYNRKFRRNLDKEQALCETLRYTGRPIMFTALTIGAGFSVLGFSSFVPTAVFGLMMVITMLSAVVGAIILLPSLMLHVELVTLWDLVRFGIGKDPREGIPLFKGMSRTEAYLILTAGTLIHIDEGQLLFRKGDVSDSMYAIISGKMDVSDNPLSDCDSSCSQCMQKLVPHLRPGDIIGESGVLDSARRSSTIIASQKGELLKINQKMIDRLHWLYPPTAHKFSLNLISIVNSRLARSKRILDEKSLTDNLTGLYNYRGFMKILEGHSELAYRHGLKLSICLIGIEFETDDPFSDYTTKNEMICLLSETLLGELRKSDILGRVNFHTFGLLFPHTPIQGAQLACTRLLKVVEENCFEINGVRMNVGFSLASLMPERGETGTDMLSRAMGGLWETEDDETVCPPADP